MRGPRRRRRGPAWKRGSLRAYGALLWLYPPSLRHAHGDEMLQLFRDTLRDEVARHGPPGALLAWADTLADLAVSLPREWPRELRSGRARARRRVVANRVQAQFMAQSTAGRRGDPMRNDRFDRFTDRARKVMSLAQEEAQRFNHNYIGTEHILLGLVREGDGVAAKVLANLGVELEKVRNSVEFIIGRGDRVVLGEIGITPRSKKVLELAIDEARRLNHHYVGTEHLLLGLVREGEGIAAGVLESLGVNLEKVRAQTIEVLHRHSGGSSGPNPAATRPRPTADLGKFSERARRVIADAITEAREREQREVGTGHALLALMQEEDGIAVRAMRQFGLDLGVARREVEQVIGQRTLSGDPPARGPVELDSHMLRMIALAAEEARQLDDRYVGTEHLLLGIIAEGDGLGGQVLLNQAANLPRLRAATIQLRAESISSRDKRPTVGQITLLCRDVAVTSAFYVQNFAAELATREAAPGEPLRVRLPGGGPLFALCPAPADAAPASGGSIELELWVGEVDLVWRTLHDAEVAGLSTVSDSPRGRTFTVLDPDGRLLSVYAHGA